MTLKFSVLLGSSILAFAVSAAVAQTAPSASQPTQVASLSAAEAAPAPPPQVSSTPDHPPSDVLNERLPRWLRFSGEIRLRGEGFTGLGYKPDDGTGYMLSRVRLNMRVQPTAWMTFFFQGQDAHVVGEDETKLAPLPPYQDTFDMRQGYVEFGDVEKRHFGLRIGRQELAFGSERLLGNANWLNTPRAFDGFRATYRGGSYRLDGFAACMNKIHDGQYNECVVGNNIYGLYSAFTKLIPKTSIEPFFFWRRQSGLKTEAGAAGIMNYGTIGFHWVVKPAKALDYDVEMARQAGSLGSDTISAWAGHWLVGYTLPSRFHPRLLAEFNYATGDHGNDGSRGTFDQIYPSGHDLYGLTDQVGWKNIEHVRGGIELKPTAKWMLGSKYSSYWLADTHDAFYNTASAVVAKSAAGTAGKWVGQELDFTGTYKLNKRTLLGGGFGHLFPGTFLKNTTPHVGYSYPYVQVVYGF